MNQGELLESYATRRSRGVLGLSTNLGIRGWIFHTFIERHLPELHISGKIIDLGSNEGFKIPSLLRKYPDRDILGIDIDPISIDQGRYRFQKEKRVAFQVADALNLSGEVQGEVALIFASQVLHHYDLEGRIVLLDECYKSLSRGGILIVSDTFMNVNSVLGVMTVGVYKKVAKSKHYYNISPIEMKEGLEFHGMKGIQVHHTIPLTRLGFYPTSMFTGQK